MTQFHVTAGGSLQGSVKVPGDKSISHRSVMFGAIAEGVTEVTGFLQGADAISTMNAFRAMGVNIEGPDAQGNVRVHGVGLHGLKAPQNALDCGNSGTTMRLLSGLLAGQRFGVTLVGDESLHKRPMRRVSQPLALMGAKVEPGEDGRPPVRITPVESLTGTEVQMTVASAQVKSALLLAGLYASGLTRVTEPAPTRDHTERMLQGFGVRVDREGLTASVEGGQTLKATNIRVPSDISSAAFFMVGASIAPDSDLLIEGVGLNPTRTGVIEILRLMGADLTILNARTEGGEPVGDVRVRSAHLKGIDIPVQHVPSAIDEFPVLFVAAALAEGTTRLTGAEELRVKESDRIATMAIGLNAIGAHADPLPDGMVIEGLGAAGAFQPGVIDSHGDHRIAMAFAMASLRMAANANAPMVINDVENVGTSFPGFSDLASRAGLKITVV